MKEKKPKVRIVLEADIDSYTWHQELVEAAGAKTKAELFWKLHEELAKQIGFKPRPE
ncbi:MAG: hypothetical protein HPY66_1674 [Firmicutes bacterium]|nr:hypothetical protein [Bacillota bacterium]